MNNCDTLKNNVYLIIWLQVVVILHKLNRKKKKLSCMLCVIRCLIK